VYLLDTNIWLERLLGQAQSAVVGRLLESLPVERMLMTDFTLHSLGVILNRLGQRAAFNQLVQDVLIDADVGLVRLAPAAMYRVVMVMERYRLDFDDAYQYVSAERENAVIVSFDGDFDRTDRGRQAPAQVLSHL
jgi:uncharacterized protein